MKFGKVFLLSALFLLACAVPIVAGCGFLRGHGFFRNRRDTGRQPPVSYAPVDQSGAGCLSCVWQATEDKPIICEAKPAVDPRQFPGIPQEHFQRIGERESYCLNGRSVSQAAVIQSLLTVADDRKELSLSFIGGSDSERAQALTLATALSLDKKTLIQSYDADNPLVKDHGFVLTGHPSVYLQAPDGKVLLRAATADKDTLALFAAKAAAYDASKDPTAAGFSLDSIEKQLSDVPVWVWIAAGVLLFLYLDKKGSHQ